MMLTFILERPGVPRIHPHFTLSRNGLLFFSLSVGAFVSCLYGSGKVTLKYGSITRRRR